MGAVSVPIYSTLTAEQSEFILQDSCCRVIFLSTEQQLRKILPIISRTPVERIVVMDPIERSHAISMAPLMHEGPESGNPGLEARARSIIADDLATIIYTSGTTGVAKGVMLTHGNLASNIEYSLKGFEFVGEQLSVSFLPLSHVTARHVDFALLFNGVTLAYCPFVDQLSQTLLEIRPTHVRFRAARLRENSCPG